MDGSVPQFHHMPFWCVQGQLYHFYPYPAGSCLVDKAQLFLCSPVYIFVYICHHLGSCVVEEVVKGLIFDMFVRVGK